MIWPAAGGKRDRGRRARRRGRWAEELCVWYLRLKGYSILARGYITGRGTGAGEIDVIARRGNLLVFVEVKIRRTRDEALRSISISQRKRLMRAAEAFLARRPDLAGHSLRFDAVVMSPWRRPCHLIDAWRDEA